LLKKPSSNLNKFEDAIKTNNKEKIVINTIRNFEK
jgi:hypothetical protein